MDENRNISVSDFDYQLPDEKIAYYPVGCRDDSKLLVFNIKDSSITDTKFRNIVDVLDKNDLLVLNDSRVIHARLLVHNATGAAIEIFCLEPLRPTNDPAVAFTLSGNVTWKCMVGNARKWKTPLVISVHVGGRNIEVTAVKGEAVEGVFEVTFSWDDTTVSFAEWIESYGKVPLPPYIHRAAEESDSERYQTVYAHHDGSVAAPTAGLHFTDELLDSLHCKGVGTEYVTLHVGAGTFKPVSSETIGGHFMHDERIVIRREFVERLLKEGSKRVVAVGTTVARTLESMFIIGAKLHLKLENPLFVGQWEYYDNRNIREVSKEDALNAVLYYMDKSGTDILKAETCLIILPTYKRQIVQGLVTNFHQPKSTLLLIVSNFVGECWRDIYAHALENGYRFLSYGDANLYI